MLKDINGYLKVINKVSSCTFLRFYDILWLLESNIPIYRWCWVSRTSGGQSGESGGLSDAMAAN